MASITDRLPFGLGRQSGKPDEPDQRHDQEPDEPDSFLEMTLQEHLEELRTRLLWASIAIVIGLIAGLLLAFPLLDQIALKTNVPNDQIQTISPTEGFVTYFKVALYIGIAIAMPVIVFQLLQFVAPGLTKRERGYLYRSLPVVVLLFVIGVAFAFFVVIPRALDFLSTFGSDVFAWNPRASEVVTFYVRLMLGIGAAFQLPVIMYLIARLGVTTYRTMASAYKIAFILILIAAAIITPTPDPFNMMLVAVPLFALYGLGIALAWFARPLDKDRTREANEDAE